MKSSLRIFTLVMAIIWLAGISPAYSDINEGFLINPNGTSELIIYPGARFTGAFGINDYSQIVGYYDDSSGRSHGFLKTGNTYISFDYPGASMTRAYGINNVGQIVGSYRFPTGPHHGFLKTGDTYISIDYPEASIIEAFGVNDSGDIIGFNYSSYNPTSGFLKTGDTYTLFRYPSLPINVTYPIDINNLNHIVGYYHENFGGWYGFLKIGEHYTTINYPGALRTWATGINDIGQIVGGYETFTTPIGFLKDPILGFISFDFPKSEYTNPQDINNLGQIVGLTQISTSTVTVPLPSAVILLGTGLGALVLYYHRRPAAKN